MYPDTLRVVKGLRVEQGRQWEEVIQKRCYGTNCALIPKSIFFSALRKYCISVEKYIISIIKCSLLLRSRFLYKLLSVLSDSSKAAVSGLAEVFSTCCRAGLEWTAAISF